jgi:hypothetical protein
MKLSLHDPRNHAPEVTPGDEWCDAEDFPEILKPAATGLPKIRKITEKKSERLMTSREGLELGLKIDLEGARPTQNKGGLEVQEIGGEVVRLDQPEPSQPKVERLYKFHPKPTKAEVSSFRRGEGKDWGKAKSRSATVWIVVASATVFTFIILGLMLQPVINASNTIQADPNKKTYVIENQIIKGIEEFNDMLLKRKKAFQGFTSFARATHPDDILPLVWNAPQVESQLRESWKPYGIPKSWSPPNTSLWSALELDGRLYGILEGHLPDHSKFTAYFLIHQNRLMIDWKATTAFASASFDDLKAGTGNPSEIRGWISPSIFYNSCFQESEYQSFRLASPNRENSVWCYIRRDHAGYPKIASLFHKGEIIQESATEKKITLGLEPGPAGAMPNQWSIREIHGIDWVTP